MNITEISNNQRRYWKKTLKDHAGTPRAVGSESTVHKNLRYARVSKLFEGDKNFSVHDVGAGIGHFYRYLQDHYADQKLDYSASEITEEYCNIAKEEHPDIQIFHRDVLLDEIEEKYDYVVLSGVFHQSEAPHDEWIQYMEALLSQSFEMARKGMVFNILTHYADFYNAGNFYANLLEVQTFVARRLSRFFRIDQAYPLFEATVHVYDPEYMRKQFPEAELQKYMNKRGNNNE